MVSIVHSDDLRVQDWKLEVLFLLIMNLNYSIVIVVVEGFCKALLLVHSLIDQFFVEIASIHLLLHQDQVLNVFVLLLSFPFAYVVLEDDVLQLYVMLMMQTMRMSAVEVVDEVDDENPPNEIVVVVVVVAVVRVHTWWIEFDDDVQYDDDIQLRDL
jgi:hypothetical protein